MQITHEEARKLIQFDADAALSAQEKTVLAAHLRDCRECSAYAEGLKEVEHILVPLMKKQWNLQPVPLPRHVLVPERSVRIRANVLLATRRAAVALVFMAFVFSAWQFTLSGGHRSTPLTIGAPPVPTPSTQSIRTTATLQECAAILYRVQKGDTLESIAHQFSVAKKEIMAANHLETEALDPAVELIVPLCDLTPTGTADPTLLATTYTPSTRPAVSTPGG